MHNVQRWLGGVREPSQAILPDEEQHVLSVPPVDLGVIPKSAAEIDWYALTAQE
jgi:hypothetical protein